MNIFLPLDLDGVLCKILVVFIEPILVVSVWISFLAFWKSTSALLEDINAFAYGVPTSPKIFLPYGVSDKEENLFDGDVANGWLNMRFISILLNGVRENAPADNEEDIFPLLFKRLFNSALLKIFCC